MSAGVSLAVTWSACRAARRAVVAAITWTMDCILDGLVAYGEAMYSGLCEPTGEAPDRRDPAGPLSSRRR